VNCITSPARSTCQDSICAGRATILPIRAHPSTQFEWMSAMFTGISKTLVGVLVRIGHRSVKHHDADICLLKNDPSALAYLQVRPHHDPDFFLFENDPAALADLQMTPVLEDRTK
jgi:hypothetical protein